jgi:membrane protein DedA with SNARE-associated domain
MLQDLSDWATQLVERLGYLGVAFLVALENVFPPIPSEVVLGLAGFTVSTGDHTFVGMLVASTVGSVVGAWVLYGLAAAVGPVRLRAIVIRYGRWIGFGEKDLDRAEAWFDRRARYAVLFGRCVPLIRSIISIPAGFRRMPLGTFTLFTLIGSLVWNTVLITAGYLLGDQWEKILDVTEPYQTLVLVLIAAGVVALIVRRVIALRRERSISDETIDEISAELEAEAQDDSVLRARLQEGPTEPT